MPQILVFVLFFAGVYFLLLRPQQQRVRRQRELITAIGVGDRVVTAGGLIGRVVDLTDDRLLLEVADGVVVELLRLAVSRRLDDSEAGSAFDGGTDEEDEEYEDDAASAEAYTAEPGGAGAIAESEHALASSEGAAPEPGSKPGGGAGALGPPLRPTQAATGSGGTTEEAATPAPGQDPI